LQKLTTLIEEIFEAEDSVAPDEDASLSQLPASFSAFFSPLTTDATRPLLNRAVMVKLEQFIRQVARPPKRSRRQNMSSPIKPSEGEIEPMSLAEIDAATLTRLLKLLERSVVLGEDIAPFAGPAMAELPGHTTASNPPSKKSKKNKAAKSSVTGDPGVKRSSRSRSRSRSRSHNDDDDAEGGADARGKTGQVTDHGECAVGTEANEDDLERLGTMLATAHDSVAAASCAISLLASDSLPKQVRNWVNNRAPTLPRS
jgi:cohesin loading factor subunit SCC2